MYPRPEVNLHRCQVAMIQRALKTVIYGKKKRHRSDCDLRQKEMTARLICGKKKRNRLYSYTLNEKTSYTRYRKTAVERFGRLLPANYRANLAC